MPLAVTNGGCLAVRKADAASEGLGKLSRRTSGAAFSHVATSSRRGQLRKANAEL